MTVDRLGPISFSPGGEDWFEFGPPDARERVGFHEYARIYAVPGLYERVFHQELGMCSADVVVGLYGRVLGELGRAPADERALDLGAGNGMGGERLRALGVTSVVGLDLEPEARVAALRDRPCAYDHYLVGALDEQEPRELERLRARRLTAVLAIAAVGAGHVAPTMLLGAVELLEPGGLLAFPAAPDQLAETEEALLTGRDAPTEELARTTYVHRRSTDGSDHAAVALVVRRR